MPLQTRVVKRAARVFQKVWLRKSSGMQIEVRLCGTLDAAKPVTVPEVGNLSKGVVVLELGYRGYPSAHGRGPGFGGTVAILKVIWVLKSLTSVRARKSQTT